MQSWCKTGAKSWSLAILLVGLAAGAHAQTFALEEALATAYETSPRLEQQRASLRATDESVARARAGWRPSLLVSGGYGYSQNTVDDPIYARPGGYPRDVTVTLRQPLFDGSTSHRVRQADAEVRVGRQSLRSVEQTVLLEAASAYVGVVSDEAKVEYQRENADLLGEQLAAMRERAEIGDVTLTDVELIEARLNAANADLALATGQLATSRAEFLRAVGRPAESLDPSPPLPQLPPGVDVALGRAVENNPDVAAAREQVRVADEAVGAAVGELLPNLSLQAQYRNSHDQIATGISASDVAITAQLNVPLYQGGENHAQVRQNRDLRTAASFGARTAELEVRQNLEAAWHAHSAARDALGHHEQRVAVAQSALAGLEEGIRAGEWTTFDLLNTAQEVVSARIALADARQNFYVSAFQLAAAMGEFTAQSLELPVALYDPQLHYERNADRWFGLGE